MAEYSVINVNFPGHKTRSINLLFYVLSAFNFNEDFALFTDEDNCFITCKCLTCFSTHRFYIYLIAVR